MIPVALIITLAEGALPTPKSILLDVQFRNVSSDPLRILKSFENPDTLPIWFELQMIRRDGTPVMGIRGGGKINLRGNLEYVTLAPDETFSLKIDVARFVVDLQPQSYQITLTYRNQYGQYCFKGEVTSKPLIVNVERVEREAIGRR